MRVELLNKGDKVISVQDGKIVIRRKNGEVDLVPLVLSGGEIFVDMDHIITIGYHNCVRTEVVNGVEITDF